MRSFVASLVVVVGCSSEDAGVDRAAKDVESCRPELREGEACAEDALAGYLVATCKCATTIPSYVTICCQDGRIERSLSCSDYAGGPTCYHRPGDSAVDTRADAFIDANDDTGDVGICGTGKHAGYSTAGCDATPACRVDGPEDACASSFCDCTGKTISGACGYSFVPFASRGACDGG